MKKKGVKNNSKKPVSKNLIISVVVVIAAVLVLSIMFYNDSVSQNNLNSKNRGELASGGVFPIKTNSPAPTGTSTATSTPTPTSTPLCRPLSTKISGTTQYRCDPGGYSISTVSNYRCPTCYNCVSDLVHTGGEYAYCAAVKDIAPGFPGNIYGPATVGKTYCNGNSIESVQTTPCSIGQMCSDNIPVCKKVPCTSTADCEKYPIFNPNPRKSCNGDVLTEEKDIAKCIITPSDPQQNYCIIIKDKKPIENCAPTDTSITPTLYLTCNTCIEGESDSIASCRPSAKQDGNYCTRDGNNRGICNNGVCGTIPIPN